MSGDRPRAFEAWSRDYERAQFRFTEENQRIGTATRELFAGWYPSFTHPMVRHAIHALLDDAMLEAFGFPRPLPLSRPILNGVLRLRGHLVRWMPPRREPNFFTDRPNRTHPNGYEIARLGPPRLIEREKVMAAAAAAKTP